MSTHILENRRIGEAYSGMSDDGNGRYKKAFDRLADGVFGDEIDESERKYEMAFNRLADAVYGDIDESDGQTTLASLGLGDFGHRNTDGEENDDDVQNGGNVSAPTVARNTGSGSDTNSDDEAGEPSEKAVSSYSDMIGRIRAQHPVQTFEEERKMIDEYLGRGDREGLNAELALHNIGLTLPFIRRYYATYYADKDEMASMGYEALMNAAHGFDPERGIKFSTYAYPYLQNTFTRKMVYTPGERVSRKSNSLDAKMKSAKGDSDDSTYGEHGIYNDVADRSGMFGAKELHEIEYKGFIDRIYDISELTATERSVLNAMFDDGRTLADVADRLGFNGAGNVDFVRRRALKKIHNALELRGMHSKTDVLAHSDRIEIPQSELGRGFSKRGLRKRI